MIKFTDVIPQSSDGDNRYKDPARTLARCDYVGEGGAHRKSSLQWRGLLRLNHQSSQQQPEGLQQSRGWEVKPVASLCPSCPQAFEL